MSQYMFNDGYVLDDNSLQHIIDINISIQTNNPAYSKNELLDRLRRCTTSDISRLLFTQNCRCMFTGVVFFEKYLDIGITLDENGSDLVLVLISLVYCRDSEPDHMFIDNKLSTAISFIDNLVINSLFTAFINSIHRFPYSNILLICDCLYITKRYSLRFQLSTRYLEQDCGKLVVYDKIRSEFIALGFVDVDGSVVTFFGANNVVLRFDLNDSVDIISEFNKWFFSIVSFGCSRMHCFVMDFLYKHFDDCSNAFFCRKYMRPMVLK